MVNKSPDAFRTISEVADALDVPQHVLRFWESRFPQVKPLKRGGGRRYYRPDDISLLRGIRGLLYDDGLTIKGMQKVLREKGVRHVIAHGRLLEVPPEPDAAVSTKAKKPQKQKAVRPHVVAETKTPPQPQQELFPDQDGDLIEKPPETLTKPDRRTALINLVAELEALRAAMIEDIAN